MAVRLFEACRGREQIRRLALDAHRVVESQHVTSTRKLVDSDEEQRLLEDLVERVKPPVPTGDEFEGLHYLLFTSFRHPPLPWGSRFGSRFERGLWYGSLDLATCFAEVAYYRLLFLLGTGADLGTISIELTAFVVGLDVARGIDLTRPPFRRHEGAISAKTSYATSLPLGSDMRAANVVGFLFVSARTAGRGINVGLFEPAFASKTPRRFRTFTCTASHHKVEFSRKSVALRTTAHRPSESFVFSRSVFEVGGALPQCR